MRKIAISALIFAALLVLTGSGDTPSIYYRSQAEADADLARYDLDNPSCQLWTNWQKMCSRTGKGGKTFCSSDKERPVRPSKPFCAEVANGQRKQFRVSDRFLSQTSLEGWSRQRYCRLEGTVLTCQSDRPFSGSHLSARRHPFCQIWAEDRAPNYRSVCSEENIRGVQNCDRLRTYRAKQSSKLYCSKRSALAVKANCLEISGFGEGPSFGHSGPYEIIAGGRRGDLAVIGIYCV